MIIQLTSWSNRKGSYNSLPNETHKGTLLYQFGLPFD